MKRRAVVRYSVLAGLGALAIGLVVSTVYAHCGYCADSAKDMVAAMDAGKSTLSKAISAAEESSKGKAVKAVCEIEGKSMHYHVYTLAGSQLKNVEVDSAGKVAKTADVKTIKDEPELKDAMPKK